MVVRHFKLCLGWIVSTIVAPAIPVMLAGCGQTAFQVALVSTRRELKETQIQGDRGLLIRDKIAIIDVDGFLVNRQKRGLVRSGENPVSLFIEKLDKAARDASVKAVVLRLNSSGGTVSASDVMYHSLRQFKRRTGKPVVTCVLGLGCSGAYYLACGTDGIVAQPSSVTGSIGTIFQTFSVAGTMEKIGVKAVAIKSGQMKDMASPLHDLDDDEREVLQGIIDNLYHQFLTVVEDGRETIDAQKLQGLADGRVFTAGQALREGLIDRIGYLQDGIEWAKEKAGVQKARVVIYHRPSGYKPNAYGIAKAGADDLGPLVNIELSAFGPPWRGGAQFLYLWQPGLE
jgi:protease-4